MCAFLVKDSRSRLISLWCRELAFRLIPGSLPIVFTLIVSKWTNFAFLVHFVTVKWVTLTISKTLISGEGVVSTNGS